MSSSTSSSGEVGLLRGNDAPPIVAILGWMERRVERCAHEMNSITTCVFTVDLSEEAVKADHAPASIQPAAALAGE